LPRGVAWCQLTTGVSAGLDTPGSHCAEMSEHSVLSHGRVAGDEGVDDFTVRVVQLAGGLDSSGAEVFARGVTAASLLQSDNAVAQTFCRSCDAGGQVRMTQR
jgi:hypothetical protein